MTVMHRWIRPKAPQPLCSPYSSVRSVMYRDACPSPAWDWARLRGAARVPECDDGLEAVAIAVYDCDAQVDTPKSTTALVQPLQLGPQCDVPRCLSQPCMGLGTPSWRCACPG